MLEGPVVEIDIVGFTSRYGNEDEKRHIVRKLQELLVEPGRFILPHGDFLKKFKRHGTGDGYYIFLDSIRPLAALEFVWRLIKELDEYNLQYGQDLPLHLRIVIGQGRIESLDDQY